MFDFLCGKVVHMGGDFITLQVGGIGFHITTSPLSMRELEVGMNDVLFHTFMSVSDNGIALYGFTDPSELEMFHLLTSVTRIGPKTGVGILGVLTPYEIRQAVLSKDLSVLTKAPGIGKKAAERIVLELKDKVDKVFIPEAFREETMENRPTNSLMDTAEALVSLGYSRSEVDTVLAKLDGENKDPGELIKEALRLL